MRYPVISFDADTCSYFLRHQDWQRLQTRLDSRLQSVFSLPFFLRCLFLFIYINHEYFHVFIDIFVLLFILDLRLICVCLVGKKIVYVVIHFLIHYGMVNIFSNFKKMLYLLLPRTALCKVYHFLCALPVGNEQQAMR
jgi:hypothetical protein